MAKEIQKMRAQENEKEKISDDLRNCVDRKGKADAVASSDVKMIEEQQPQQEMIQSENGNRKGACSDETKFEETSQEMDAWTTGMWVQFPSLTEHCTSMEMDNTCTSAIKKNSEILTAFTCQLSTIWRHQLLCRILPHRHRNAYAYSSRVYDDTNTSTSSSGS